MKEAHSRALQAALQQSSLWLAPRSSVQTQVTLEQSCRGQLAQRKCLRTISQTMSKKIDVSCVQVASSKMAVSMACLHCHVHSATSSTSRIRSWIGRNRQWRPTPTAALNLLTPRLSLCFWLATASGMWRAVRKPLTSCRPNCIKTDLVVRSARCKKWRTRWALSWKTAALVTSPPARVLAVTTWQQSLWRLSKTNEWVNRKLSKLEEYIMLSYLQPYLWTKQAHRHSILSFISRNPT